MGAVKDKKLGLVSAAALVTGNIVGSGVFLLPATLAAFGSITLVSWILSTLGFMALGLVFAALVRLRPQAENLVAHVREGTGPFFGFQAVILYWLCCVTGNVAISVGAAGYLGVFVSALKTPWNTGLTAAGIACLMTAVNLLGPRFIGRLSGLTVLIGLIPVFVIGGLGWMWFDPALWAKAWNVSHQPAATAVTASLVQTSFGFLGVESAAIAAKVVRNPERNLGPATIAGVGLSALVYIAACTAIFGLLPVEQLARSGAPFSDAIARTLGPIAGAALAACALAKTMGALGGWVLVTAETSESAADQGMLPRIFGRDGGPSPARRSLVINLILMVVLALVTISPSAAKQYGFVVGISVVWNLAIYILACVALLRFTRDARDRFYALFAIVFCVVVAAYSGTETLIWSGWAVAFTTALFVVMAIVKGVGRLRRQPA
jgi:arginine:agmatine antiporter